MNGTELLAEFRDNRSETAFGELVRRYTNLVYSVANRRLGNASLAQEMTQLVFIRLAKAVPKLRGDNELAAWLHRTTVHVSIDLWRSESRRRAREANAAVMHAQPEEAVAWNDLALVLDESVNELNDPDRQIILLRFFNQKTMRELGAALGISEDAAKMRVNRALGRLRDKLGARGVASASALALGTALSQHAVEAAPAQLVASLAASNFAAVAGGGTGIAMVDFLPQVLNLKFVAGTVAVLSVGTAALLWLHTQRSPIGRGFRGVDGGGASRATKHRDVGSSKSGRGRSRRSGARAGSASTVAGRRSSPTADHFGFGGTSKHE